MTPDIYYYTLTGNVKRFLDNCGLEAHSIDSKAPNRDFVLVTNTLGFGEIPPLVDAFLKEHGRHLRGVAASGNRNWGDNYAKAGRLISTQYGVPLLLTFELSGTQDDVRAFKRKLNELNGG